MENVCLFGLLVPRRWSRYLWGCECNSGSSWQIGQIADWDRRMKSGKRQVLCTAVSRMLHQVAQPCRGVSSKVMALHRPIHGWMPLNDATWLWKHQKPCLGCTNQVCRSSSCTAPCEVGNLQHWQVSEAELPPGLVLPGKESLPQAEASKGECHRGMKVCKTHPANRKQMGLLSMKHIEEKNANGTKICRRLLEIEENNLLSCKVNAKRINMHKGLRFRF